MAASLASSGSRTIDRVIARLRSTSLSNFQPATSKRTISGTGGSAMSWTMRMANTASIASSVFFRYSACGSCAARSPKRIISASALKNAACVSAENGLK